MTETPEMVNSAPFAQFTTDEAYAMCGPAAVVAFVRANGHNLTLSEAQTLAEQSGWSIGNRG